MGCLKLNAPKSEYFSSMPVRLSYEAGIQYSLSHLPTAAVASGPSLQAKSVRMDEGLDDDNGDGDEDDDDDDGDDDGDE